MKRTKKYPFLLVQQQRFQLHYHNQSGLEHDLPTQKQCYQWIWHALKQRYTHAQIGLVFLNEEDARTYNRDYRQKDYATNILSFEENDVSQLHPFLPQAHQTLYGDLVVCPQVVLREALAQHKTPLAHFAHMLIHGTLHLMGYDHLNDEDAALMENREIQLLAQLGFANPYLEIE